MISRRRFLNATPLLLGPFIPSAQRLLGAEPDKVSVAAPPKIGRSSRSLDIASIRPARVTAASAKTFKLLQITDLHFLNKTAKEDELTINDCHRHLERHTPDLVVATGDLWHDNPNGRGERGLELVLKMFETGKVPWTMCWGNHDLLDQYQAGHDLLEQAPHSRYRGGSSHGDYRIEVFAQGGDAEGTGTPAMDLFFLNSSDEGLTAWQIGALGEMTAQIKASRPKPVPAFVFFHIPILEYETRIRADTIKGVKLEGVGRCKENGQAFSALTGAKTIRACFCGHNHTNDYTVKADQLDLVYGRSSGYAGYGGDSVRKGAKLIEIDLANGNYQQATVFADGTKHFV
jgi:hypothetical protein